ncbi:MAG: hypothetical protein M1828_002684 [Chrysothrix sp. TS-e1954]|nr:MAG: hypothetical protein M1828_002684 [Chrysothrix sp. TS-e1954]
MTSSPNTRPFTVDIHTHHYPPSYISHLTSRTTVPYIHAPTSPTSTSAPRLIILPSDDDASLPQSQRGRPLTSAFSSIDEKLAFMDAHNIDTAVISLANPWLDFLEDSELATQVARDVNDDFQRMCAESRGRLFAFGVLPLSGPVEGVVGEVRRLKGLEHMRGVIMGTSGLGRGLDDPRLEEVWTALEETDTLVFLHPHYGLPAEAYGVEHQQGGYGHVLPLAIGFPVETTIAVAKMWLSGVFDRHPRLKMLLAHSGGTLPFLAGRLESCVAHDRVLKERWKGETKRSIWDVLQKNIFLDAVVYSEVGLKCAIEASGARGAERLMFGTDHPFFPPLDSNETQWLSVGLNTKAVESAFEPHQRDQVAAVMGVNAARILDLPVGR